MGVIKVKEHQKKYTLCEYESGGHSRAEIKGTLHLLGIMPLVQLEEGIYKVGVDRA
jgi:hypothetical protein